MSRWRFWPRGSLTPVIGNRPNPIPIVIEAATWYDARAEARVEFQSTDLLHDETLVPPRVVVRWEGTDAGPQQNRRKIVERRK